ncbi:MAG: hypothetical protein J6O49_02965 [Bacteroidaceae bacterium]|nr:hypothetical protein [Bacteroidaceae bacterium]
MVILRYKNKTIECDFADRTFDGDFMARFADERRLPIVAKDFDRLESVTVEEALTTNIYTDVDTLLSISLANGKYTVRLGAG